MNVTNELIKQNTFYIHRYMHLLHAKRTWPITNKEQDDQIFLSILRRHSIF